MVRLRTDPDGKLQELEAVPPQVEPQRLRPRDFRLEPGCFDAAGLDQCPVPARGPAVDPAGQLGHARRVDRRRSAAPERNCGWKPRRGAGGRCRSAIIGPWTVPERMEPPDSGQSEIALAWRSSTWYLRPPACWRGITSRARKGGPSRRGKNVPHGTFCAWRPALFLDMHHSATRQELSGFWRVVAVAFLNAGIVWVFYLALEPWVRRRWPHTMISWTRYTTRGIRDPLVGRDLLFGAGCGALGGVLLVLETAPAPAANRHSRL